MDGETRSIRCVEYIETLDMISKTITGTRLSSAVINKKLYLLSSHYFTIHTESRGVVPGIYLV